MWMTHENFYYISFKIEEKYSIGFFTKKYNARSAIFDSTIAIENELNVNEEDIKVNYVKRIDGYSIIDICNSIFKIDQKYSKFLEKRKLINRDIGHLLYNCFAKDIKKLILPGNIDFKIEMISKDEKYIELVDRPSIEMQNLITDTRYITYVENPTIELVNESIKSNSETWLVENIDFLCKYQNYCLDTFKEKLNRSYIQSGSRPERIFIEKLLLSKLNFEYKFFFAKHFLKDSYISPYFLIENFEKITFNTDSKLLYCLIEKYPILIFKMNFLTDKRKVFMEKKCFSFDFSYETFNSDKIDLVEYIENYEIETSECRKELLMKLPLDIKFSERLDKLMNMYYRSLSASDKIDIFLYIFDKIDTCNDFYKKLIVAGAELVSCNIEEYVDYWWKFVISNDKISNLVFKKITSISPEDIANVANKLSKKDFKHKRTGDGSHPVWESSTDIYEIIIDNKLKLKYTSKQETHTSFGWSGDNDWETTTNRDDVEIFIGKYHFNFSHCFRFEEDLYISKFIFILNKLFDQKFIK